MVFGRPLLERFEPHKDSQISAQRDDDIANIMHSYQVEGDTRTVTMSNLETGARTVEFYDALGRKTREVETGFDGQDVETFTVYDERTGNVASQSEPVFVGETPRIFATTTYDERGRAVETKSPNGGVINHRYGDFSDEATETVFEVKPDGSIGDLIERRVIGRSVKDALGRVVAQSYGEPDSDEFYEIRYVFDELDRVIEIHDSFDRLLHTVDFGDRLDDKPVAIYDEASGYRRLSYDFLDHLITVEADGDAENSVRSDVRYDQLERVVHETTVDSSTGFLREIEKVYEESEFGQGLVSSSRAFERQSNGNETEKTCKYFYDAYAHPRSVEHQWKIKWDDDKLEKDIRLRLGTKHDGKKGGRLEEITYPKVKGIEGGKASYRYDDSTGAVTEIFFDGKSIWRLGGEGLDAHLKPYSCHWGNGLFQAFDYDDEVGRLQKSRLSRKARTLLEMSMGYDTSGNVRLVDFVQASADKDQPDFQANTQYGFDSRNQLVTIENDKHRTDFSYRADGARLEKQTDGQITSYAYDGDNLQQLSSVSGSLERKLTYDSAGRLVEEIDADTGEKRLLDWTTHNRLARASILGKSGVSLGAMCYAYGSQGALCTSFSLPERALTINIDHWFEVIFRQNDSAPLLRSHICSGGQRVATVERQKDQPERILFYHRDHVGSIRLITDQDGKVVSSMRYGAFGEPEALEGEKPDLAFGGYRAEAIKTGGFNHYGTPSRPYEPDYGRFLCPDAVADVGNGAFGFNLYGFCGNNPISAVDPSGFNSQKFFPFFIMPDRTNEVSESWREARQIWGAKNGLLVRHIFNKEDISKEIATVFHPGLNDMVDKSKVFFNTHGPHIMDMEAIGESMGKHSVPNTIMISCGRADELGRMGKTLAEGEFVQGGGKGNLILHDDLVIEYGPMPGDKNGAHYGYNIPNDGKAYKQASQGDIVETKPVNFAGDAKDTFKGKDSTFKAPKFKGRVNSKGANTTLDTIKKYSKKISAYTDKLGMAGDMIDKLMLPMNVGDAVSEGDYFGAAGYVAEAVLLSHPKTRVVASIVETTIGVADYFAGGSVSQTLKSTARETWSKTKDWFNSWW